MKHFNTIFLQNEEILSHYLWNEEQCRAYEEYWFLPPSRHHNTLLSFSYNLPVEGIILVLCAGTLCCTPRSPRRMYSSSCCLPPFFWWAEHESHLVVRFKNAI